MSRDFSVKDIYLAPMAGHQRNGLPETRGYVYSGLGYDLMDPTDPGHPDYVNPRSGHAQRKTDRQAADEARANTMRVRTR